MSKGILVIALILVALAGGLAWFVGKSIEPESHSVPIQAPATDSRETAAALQSINARLEAIEKRLVQLSESGSNPAARSGPRTGDPEPQEALLQAIRELKPAVGTALSPSPWPILLPKGIQTAPRWFELQKFFEEYNRDRPEAMRTVLFQPATKIWERFGAPNQFPALEGVIGSGPNAIGYTREAETGVTDVEFFFECGFVVNCYATGN